MALKKPACGDRAGLPSEDNKIRWQNIARFSVACDCLSWKHKVQLSKAEVNKDTFAGSSPQPFQHRTATPSEVPYTQGSLHSRFEPPDVLSFCGRSPQRHTMRTGERWQSWAGHRGCGGWGLSVQAREPLPPAGARVTCPWSSPRRGKSEAVWVCGLLLL